MFRPSTASPKRVKSLFLASCALSVAALLAACSGTTDTSPPPAASPGASDAAVALFNEAKAPKAEWFGPTEAPTPVASATVGNTFVLLGDELVTPSLDQGILPGITRRILLNHAKELRLKPVERAVPLEDLVRADAVFLCNSLRSGHPRVPGL